MDSLRKEIGRGLLYAATDGRTKRAARPLTKLHLLRGVLSARAIIPRYPFDCVHVKEPRNQPPPPHAGHSRHQSELFSSYAGRRGASPLFRRHASGSILFTAPKPGYHRGVAQQYNSQAVHPLLYCRPRLSYMPHSSHASGRHAFIITNEIGCQEFVFRFNDTSSDKVRINFLSSILWRQ